ncbi:tetratricopeptide repeat protein [Microcoleus sp. PH2017_30_WIL_O_A]|uniref:tetratricopeptide repeat protein n=1 Tax=Microcoleus sp. PH2017_30_WIL_O_A TaxID=2798840 RepID=UPI001D292B49|nr:tetratricopeptide repeat protein [Microcoleus sp. PH2017_30_WIL_O_A]MCC3587531.1 sel1 repeat family protein [Microcoleus sp. PH2017_30_WIL_O_A]
MSDLEKGIATFNTQDYTQAFSLLKPLAEQGNAESQCIIANMYHLGLGREKMILEAIKWYIKSAEQGYGVASNNLAGIYLCGADGVAADRTEAEKWFQTAREQGFLHIPISSDYWNQTRSPVSTEQRKM